MSIGVGMAVLVEGLSVIVRRDSIDAKYEGGWEGFLDDLPSGRSCHDDEITCVIFMSSLDTRTYVQLLESKGLVFDENDHSIDIAVVDQNTGPTLSTHWLQFVHNWFPVPGADDKVSGCWFLESNPFPDSGGLILPAGFEDGGVCFYTPPDWEYETSLSKNDIFVPDEEVEERLKFLRRERFMDVYLDTETGDERYVARPILEGETEGVMISRLEHIFYEVMRIERTMGSLDPVRDKEDLEDCTERLRIGLLPTVREMAEKTCRNTGIAHHVLGLILRRLGRIDEAEIAFREAKGIDPNHFGNLMELVCCLLQKHEYDDALYHAQRAVDLSPDDAGALGNLALCLMYCGQIVEAKDVIDRAVGFDPDDKINLHLQDYLHNSIVNAEPPGPVSEEESKGLPESE